MYVQKLTHALERCFFYIGDNPFLAEKILGSASTLVLSRKLLRNTEEKIRCEETALPKEKGL